MKNKPIASQITPTSFWITRAFVRNIATTLYACDLNHFQLSPADF